MEKKGRGREEGKNGKKKGKEREWTDGGKEGKVKRKGKGKPKLKNGKVGKEIKFIHPCKYIIPEARNRAFVANTISKLIKEVPSPPHLVG